MLRRTAGVTIICCAVSRSVWSSRSAIAGWRGANLWSVPCCACRAAGTSGRARRIAGGTGRVLPLFRGMRGADNLSVLSSSASNRILDRIYAGDDQPFEPDDERTATWTGGCWFSQSFRPETCGSRVRFSVLSASSGRTTWRRISSRFLSAGRVRRIARSAACHRPGGGEAEFVGHLGGDPLGQSSGFVVWLVVAAFNMDETCRYSS